MNFHELAKDVGNNYYGIVLATRLLAIKKLYVRREPTSCRVRKVSEFAFKKGLANYNCIKSSAPGIHREVHLAMRLELIAPHRESLDASIVKCFHPHNTNDRLTPLSA